MQSSRLLIPLTRAGVVSTQSVSISSCTPLSVTEMHRFRSPVLLSNRGQLVRYGGRQTVDVLPGDGIGPEMINFAHVPVDFEEVALSSQLSSGEHDLDNAITAIKRIDIALKGNIETIFDDPQFKSRNLELRRRLDMFANVLHLRHSPRQEKVTAVDKANIQKLGDGLFLKVAREMAKNEYPQIQFESMIVDNASMQPASRPQQFDIMLIKTFTETSSPISPADWSEAQASSLVSTSALTMLSSKLERAAPERT